MLHEFVTLYRDAIIARTRDKVTSHSGPLASAGHLEHGVPLFLTQLSETLKSEATGTPSVSAIGTSAALHGRDLLTLGFTVSQVVHVYGDSLPGPDFEAVKPDLEDVYFSTLSERTRVEGP